MSRIYNFSAGPAVLPEPVLQEAAAEMLNYRGTGMSVMEMSHRSAAYQAIIDEAEADLREIMNIPDNYTVLFLQGGASTQFSMIPLNLMNKNNKADFIVTGQWANKAYKEAARYGNARVIASSVPSRFFCKSAPYIKSGILIEIPRKMEIAVSRFFLISLISVVCS